MTCVWCYAHTLVISAIGYTDCSLFSYIENTNLLTKDSLCSRKIVFASIGIVFDQLSSWINIISGRK